MMERLVSFYYTSYVHSRGVSYSFPDLCMPVYRGWRRINYQKSVHACSCGLWRWYDVYLVMLYSTCGEIHGCYSIYEVCVIEN